MTTRVQPNVQLCGIHHYLAAAGALLAGTCMRQVAKHTHLYQRDYA